VYGLKIGKDKGVNRCDYHQRHIDDEVGVVPPPTADAATISRRNGTHVFAQASGRSSHDPPTAVTSDVTALGHDLEAQRRSSLGVLPRNTATRIATEQRVPQSSARIGSKTVTAAGTSEASDLPQAPTRRPGSPSGIGNFVFRR